MKKDSAKEKDILTFKDPRLYDRTNSELRCPRCGKLLAFGKIALGFVEIQCNRQRCKAIVKINQYGCIAVN